MTPHTDITRIPLRRPWSWVPYPADLLFAAGEGAGEQAQTAGLGRILIIEDDLLVASQIEAALTEAGFEIVALATTGEEALEIVRSQSPDLAVVDIRLAGDRDGVDTAIELFRTHRIRCIFASAHSDPHARRRAAPADPLGWLQKPYTMVSLTDMVRKALNELRGNPLT